MLGSVQHFILVFFKGWNAFLQDIVGNFCISLPYKYQIVQVVQLLLVGGLEWFGPFFIFPYIGNVIIPTDELHDFSEGRAQPPTS